MGTVLPPESVSKCFVNYPIYLFRIFTNIKYFVVIIKHICAHINVFFLERLATSKNGTVNQCLFNVGAAGKTPEQHRPTLVQCRRLGGLGSHVNNSTPVTHRPSSLFK